MSIQKNLEEMKLIQENILNYVENEADFTHLQKIFQDNKVRDDHYKLKLVLHLILRISNNHFRPPNFFDKIFDMLNYFKTEISQHFTNNEIFKIFKSNKRILLYLIEENLMKIDCEISNKMDTVKYSKMKYPEYFYNEIKKFLLPTDKKRIHKKIKDKLDENFNEKRKIGENDNKLCQLIRNDSVEDFISFVNQTNMSLKSVIKTSIFETNQFLLEKSEVTLIEYAAFYGSIQIFQYLKLNKVPMQSSLFLYAIHGKNAEIIHLLEEIRIECNYIQCLNESIKCHHNDISNYVLNRSYLSEESIAILEKCIKFYNFGFIQKVKYDEFFFYYLCQYDYYSFVEILVKNDDIDINKMIILDFNILIRFLFVHILSSFISNKFIELILEQLYKILNILYLNVISNFQNLNEI